MGDQWEEALCGSLKGRGLTLLGFLKPSSLTSREVKARLAALRTSHSGAAMATIATSMPAAGTEATESRLLMASTGAPRHPGLLHDKHMLVCQEVLVLALFFPAWQHNKLPSPNTRSAMVSQ